MRKSGFDFCSPSPGALTRTPAARRRKPKSAGWLAKQAQKCPSLSSLSSAETEGTDGGPIRYVKRGMFLQTASLKSSSPLVLNERTKRKEKDVRYVRKKRYSTVSCRER